MFEGQNYKVLTCVHTKLLSLRAVTTYLYDKDNLLLVANQLFLVPQNVLHFPTHNKICMRWLDGWVGCVIMYSLRENLFVICIC